MSLFIGIKHRGDTAANFTAANPVLLDRQLAFETDSFTLDGGIRYYKVKFGDGATAWNSLPYARFAGIGGGGGSTAFIGLTDVPASYSGQGGKYVKVTEAADGLEFEVIEAADLPTGIDATKLADGSISNTEFQHLNGVSSNIQTQLDARELLTNKATDFSTVNDTKYPTVEAVTEYVATAVSGLYDDRGNYDASVNTFPASGGSGTAGAVLKGDIWTVSVAGTLGGNAVQIGDLVRALTNAPGQTSSNWAITQNNITYVPENQANKENSTLDTSTTKYPTNRLVKEQVDLKQDSATALQLGETSSTAYRGDRGKTGYDYSQIGHLPLAGGNLSGAVNENASTVAAASSIDLSAAQYWTITGNTGITAIGSLQAGSRRKVRFTGTPTITHNATSMILPNAGSNIVCAAGDTATFVSLGSGNWVCTQYQRASGAALAGGSSSITVGTTPIANGTDTYVPFNNAGVVGESSLLQVITSISRVVVGGTLVQNGEIYAYKFYSRNAPNYWDMDGGASTLHTDGGGAHAQFLDTGMLLGDAAYSTRDASAVMQIDSISRGLLPPRMTTTQRNAISSPANGLVIYNTTDSKHQGYNGSWNDLY